MDWFGQARHPRFLLAYVFVTTVGLGVAGGLLFGMPVGIATFVFFLAAELLGLKLGAEVTRRLRL